MSHVPNKNVGTLSAQPCVFRLNPVTTGPKSDTKIELSTNIFLVLPWQLLSIQIMNPRVRINNKSVQIQHAVTASFIIRNWCGLRHTCKSSSEAAIQKQPHDASNFDGRHDFSQQSPHFVLKSKPKYLLQISVVHMWNPTSLAMKITCELLHEVKVLTERADLSLTPVENTN